MRRSAGAVLPARRSRRRSWIARQDWLLAVALAFFVGVTVWFGRAIEDFFAPSGKSIGTPSFVGETLSDAISTADRSRLRTTVLQRIASDRYPRDIVMRQDPGPGALVREGRQISLVVSTGVVIFPMPDLRYESLREVGLDLSHSKLQLGKVRYVRNDEVPSNRVVSQNPPPLSSVRPGTVVSVELSKGGAPTVRVPDFLNMSIDEARLVAIDAKIHLGQVVWTPFGRYGPPRGEVVRQDPGPGAAIDSAQLVSLQISAGPRESGYIVRQVHATATVPDPGDPAGKSPVVRLEVRDDTGTWNVYNAYAEPKQKLDFNLTVVGTAELDMYVNNELLSATKLGVEPPAQAKQQLRPLPAAAKPARATPVPEVTTQP